MPMLLLDLDDDAMLQVLHLFLSERGGAMLVWKLVSKKMLRLAHLTQDHEQSSLCAMGASIGLVQLARQQPGGPGNVDKELLLSVVRGKHVRTFYQIHCFSHDPTCLTTGTNWSWALGTHLMTPLAHLKDSVGKLDRLLAVAIESGSLEMVQLLVLLCDFRVGYHAATRAARFGHLAIFEWILELQKCWEGSGCYKARSRLPTDILNARWGSRASTADMTINTKPVRPRRFDPIYWSEEGNIMSLTRAAAQGGNLDLVKRFFAELVLRGPNPKIHWHEPYSHAALMAAHFDHVDIVDWATEQLAENEDLHAQCLWTCINEACSHHAFKSVVFLAKRMGDDFDAAAVLEECEYDFAVSKCMMKTLGVSVEYGMMGGAVIMDMTRYNHEKSGDDFPSMEYIHSKGCPKDIPEDFHYSEDLYCEHRLDAYEAVVHADNQTRVNPNSMTGERGVKALRWLYQRGYALKGSYAMKIALKNDDLFMVGALMVMGVPFEADFYARHDTALNLSEELTVVDWARRQGYHIPDYD